MLALGLDKPSLLVSCVARERGQKRGEKWQKKRDKKKGVMGDNRTYENAVCIRVVDASDGMTASFSRLPYELLENCSRRIINEVEGLNRVVYDISSKPPATIEWE